MSRKQKKRRRGTFLMTAGVVLLAAAFVLAVLNIREDQNAGRASREILTQMDDVLVLAQQAETVNVAVGDDEPDFVRHPDMEMPTRMVDGEAYVGVLELPRLERTLPVMQEWSYPRLKIAPCMYSGSIYSHDAVISGHNYEEHFRYLWQLEPGDEIRFTDVSGNVFVYETVLQEILAPYEVEHMTTPNDAWDLTVFTCKTGGRMRITTRFKLVSYTCPQESE